MHGFLHSICRAVFLEVWAKQPVGSLSVTVLRARSATRKKTDLATAIWSLAETWVSPTFITQVLPDLNFCGMFFFIAIAKGHQLIARKHSIPTSYLPKGIKPNITKVAQSNMSQFRGYLDNFSFNSSPSILQMRPNLYAQGICISSCS